MTAVGLAAATPATVRYVAATATVRMVPRKPLRRLTRYRVVIGNGFTGAAGNFNDQDAVKPGAQQMTWTFHTR